MKPEGASALPATNMFVNPSTPPGRSGGSHPNPLTSLARLQLIAWIPARRAAGVYPVIALRDSQVKLVLNAVSPMGTTEKSDVTISRSPLEDTGVFWHSHFWVSRSPSEL